MSVFIIILGFGITYFSIISLGAASGLISERAGIFNIGINGMMIIGGLVYSIFCYIIKDDMKGMQFAGYAIAMLAAGLFAILHGIACIKFKSNQIISGTAINILALGLALIIIKVVTKQDTVTVSLDDIKLAVDPAGVTTIGSAFGINFFVTIAIIIILWFTLTRTKWGLRLRSVGENPAAADSAGINVFAKQYQGVFISGMLAGLAGAFFAQKIHIFSGNVQGFGFLSLAVMILGQWRTYFTTLASLIFGLLVGFALFISTDSTIIPSLAPYSELLKAIPFVVTLVGMATMSKVSLAPKGAGVAYDKSLR